MGRTKRGTVKDSRVALHEGDFGIKIEYVVWLPISTGNPV